MKAKNNKYLLTPILHKDSYQLTDDIVIAIDKSFENNLRERNPQLGTVEAMPDNNFLNLKVGDVVACNHFTFYGDIGQDKAFTFRDHFEHEGKKYFPATEFQIFFKYNDKQPEVLSGYILCEYNIEVEEHFGVYFGEKESIMCTHGIYAGKEVIVLKNAMYLITLDKKEYYKVREDEVVWVDGRVVGDNLLVKLLPEKQHEIYTLKTNNQTAIALTALNNIMVGDVLQIYRNQGVETPQGYCIPMDTVIGIWEDSTQFNDISKLTPTA